MLFNCKTFIYLIFSLILYSNCKPGNDHYEQIFQNQCASCHGQNMEGSTLAAALVGKNLIHGESISEIIASISTGYAEGGMPAFQDTLTDGEISGIAILISEKRSDYSMIDFKFNKELTIPENAIPSEELDFRLEVVAEELEPWPYSIAPLPDEGFLLVEKMRGLSIISANGEQSPLIEGLPKVSTAKEASKDAVGLIYGLGWMLDVALHPDYEENGWIYLSYGERCKRCSEWSQNNNTYVSMLKIIRGRINDNKWQDEEVIWEVDKDYFTPSAETTMGGRLTFDDKGHLYFSMGAKLFYPHDPPTIESFYGIQDKSTPYGKIHRIHDDGRIPQDNPFAKEDDAFKSIWTIGHRSPQGLEFDIPTSSLWQTEMGPRGGDEVNFLEEGKNYGWPLISKGVNYSGTKVEFGNYIDINPDEMELEEPIVDLTPAPAVSSFAICRSDKYPGWESNLIVGTLKGIELYRMVVEDGKVTHFETLIKDLARIRDVEIGFDGYIYLLLEHSKGAKIVRLMPSS